MRVSRAGCGVAFERLGPAYIKLGQIVSSGRGLFPEELVAEFKLLRDRVPPEPFERGARVVEAELGRPLGEVFASFDETLPRLGVDRAGARGAAARAARPWS